MKKVHEIPSLHSLSLKTSTLGMGLGQCRRDIAVPREYLDEFLKVQFGREMEERWASRADEAPESDEDDDEWQVATDYMEKAEKEWDKICDNHENKKQRTEGKEDWKKLCTGDADWKIEADDKDDEKTITKDDLPDMIIEAYEKLALEFDEIDTETEMDRVFARLKDDVLKRIS